MITERPHVGQRCWAKSIDSYPLPEGLAPRTPLQILSIVYFEVVARDDHGREWELCTINIDAGQVAYLDGERCHESHAKFASYLRHWLAELQQRLANVRKSSAWRKPDLIDRIEEIHRLLARNGYDPATQLPPGSSPPEVTDIPDAPSVYSKRATVLLRAGSAARRVSC